MDDLGHEINMYNKVLRDMPESALKRSFLARIQLEITHLQRKKHGTKTRLPPYFLTAARRFGQSCKAYMYHGRNYLNRNVHSIYAVLTKKAPSQEEAITLRERYQRV